MIRNRNLRDYLDELDRVGIPHPNFKENINVLDVGCGYSLALCDIADIVTKGNLVGVETDNPLEAYNTSIKNTESYDNIVIQNKDIRFIESEDDYFDIVMSIHCLQYTFHIVPSLIEIIRVLKSGGKAYLIGGKPFYLVDPKIYKKVLWNVNDFKYTEYTHYTFLTEFMKNIVTVDNYGDSDDRHSGNMVVITKI